MLQLCKTVFARIIQNFQHANPDLGKLNRALRTQGITTYPIDHIAMIDLPGPQIGLTALAQLFSILGYIHRGQDYLPTKQNDFQWLAAADSWQQSPNHALPQVVVADFRLDEMPANIRQIINRYSQQAQPFAADRLAKLVHRAIRNDSHAHERAVQYILAYLRGRDWALPSRREFDTIFEFNELLAWVLIYGRCPNHVTIATHLLGRFTNLNEFLGFITDKINTNLNMVGGKIKGCAANGMIQAALCGPTRTIYLIDDIITLPGEFLEFIWRYPQTDYLPRLWQDYYTDFIATNANRVIESLYPQDLPMYEPS